MVPLIFTVCFDVVAITVIEACCVICFVKPLVYALVDTNLKFPGSMKEQEFQESICIELTFIIFILKVLVS